MTGTSPRPACPAPAARPTRDLAALVGALVLLAGCGGGATVAPDDAAAPADPRPAATTDDGPAAEPTEPTGPGEGDEPTGDADAQAVVGADGPEESFRTWLDATLAADADRACAYLSDGLAERMVAEMTADGWPGVTDCASMTRTASAVYEAVGAELTVDLTLVEQTADRAVLDVRYASGTCGVAVMVPVGTRWVMDERTEEQC